MTSVTNASKVFREDKFRELSVYIIVKCERDKYQEATKLNKILFYSDFLAYKRLGRAITWASYIALESGPAPAPLPDIRASLEQSGDFVVVKRGRQHRLCSTRDPNLALFSAEEISIVDEVIEELRSMDASSVGDLSLTFLGWKAARAEHEATGRQVVIPYETVFVSNQPMDEFEREEGLELARRNGWPI